MLEGTVKWFDEAKGFGFINVKGRKDDVFVHLNEVHNSGYDTLFAKDIVEFEIVEDNRGRAQATNLTAYEPTKPEPAK
ncbi:MAG: cold shock domain-containing protein [Bacteroidota bacterium]